MVIDVVSKKLTVWNTKRNSGLEITGRPQLPHEVFPGETFGTTQPESHLESGTVIGVGRSGWFNLPR